MPASSNRYSDWSKPNPIMHSRISTNSPVAAAPMLTNFPVAMPNFPVAAVPMLTKAPPPTTLQMSKAGGFNPMGSMMKGGGNDSMMNGGGCNSMMQTGPWKGGEGCTGYGATKKATTHVFNFNPGSIGVRYDYDTGEVYEIAPGGQAD